MILRETQFSLSVVCFENHVILLVLSWMTLCLSITLILEKERVKFTLFMSSVFLLIKNFAFRKQHFVMKICHLLFHDVEATVETSEAQRTKVEDPQAEAEEKRKAKA